MNLKNILNISESFEKSIVFNSQIFFREKNTYSSNIRCKNLFLFSEKLFTKFMELLKKKELKAASIYSFKRYKCFFSRYLECTKVLFQINYNT